MKTTVEVSDDLYRRAKSEAALRGRKLKDLVEEGLRLVLETPRTTPGRRSLAGLMKAARGVVDSSNFALRLQPSLLEEARKLAEFEGVALNQLINVAVAEKLSALRTEDYFSQRAARASLPKAFKILKRAGAGNPPMKGDEMPVKRRRR